MFRFGTKEGWDRVLDQYTSGRTKGIGYFVGGLFFLFVFILAMHDGLRVSPLLLYGAAMMTIAGLIMIIWERISPRATGALLMLVGLASAADGVIRLVEGRPIPYPVRILTLPLLVAGWWLMRRRTEVESDTE